MDSCTKCNIEIKDGEMRANFPTGTLCKECGEPVNDLLEMAETLLKLYNDRTGAHGRIRFF